MRGGGDLQKLPKCLVYNTFMEIMVEIEKAVDFHCDAVAIKKGFQKLFATSEGKYTVSLRNICPLDRGNLVNMSSRI